MSSFINTNNHQRLLEESFVEFIHEKIAEFNISGRKSLEFPSFLTPRQHYLVEQIANGANLRTRVILKNNVNHIVVYKKNSMTLLEEIPLELSDESRRLLKDFLNNYPVNEKEIHDVRSSNEKSSQPKPAKDFSARMATIGRSVGCQVKIVPPPAIEKKTNRIIETCKLDILEKIAEHRVVIVCGRSGSGKSTLLPKYILEEATKQNAHCQILSAQVHSISAISCSETVAKIRNEQVGSTVGYQVHLESKSSACTNLLYTTSSFLLRCLIGSSSGSDNDNENVNGIGLSMLSSITHIIIDDMHIRDAHTDILLLRMKYILQQFNFKLIILTDRMDLYQLQTFVKNNVMIEISEVVELASTNYFEDIFYMMNVQTNNLLLDKLLDDCIYIGSLKCFDQLISAIEDGIISVNSCHSKTQFTPLIVAAYQNRLEVVQKLIELGAYVLACDCNQKSALNWAREKNHLLCIQYLSEVILKKTAMPLKNARLRNSEVAQHLSIIRWLYEKMSVKKILYFLPSYYHIIKLKNALEEYCKNESIPIGVHTIHENMAVVDYKKLKICLENERCKTVILGTELAETLISRNDVDVVIDTGVVVKKIYNPFNDCYEEKFAWISKSQVRRRLILAKTGGKFLCLYSKQEYSAFNEMDEPEILRIRLDKLCLTMRVTLSIIQIKENLANVMDRPSDLAIDRSLDYLKKIGALDALGGITSLGVKLINIPLSLHLAKAVISSVVLQCMDPVVTIAVALEYGEWMLRDCSPSCRELLSEDACSDHFILLRLFQKWQNSELNSPSSSIDPAIECALETICLKRAEIVASLRACSLIHSTGYMSMQYINMKVENWALIKACLLIGLYPNICLRENGNTASLKYFQELPDITLSADSTLSNRTFSDNMNISEQNPQSTLTSYPPTNWIVFSEKMNIENYIQFKCNSIITPLTIALFAGPSYVSEEDALTPYSVDESNFSWDHSRKQFSRFTIDEWTSFIITSEDAVLLLQCKQKFLSLFTLILSSASDGQKMRKIRHYLNIKLKIVQTLSDLMRLEDVMQNLYCPQKVGERPKAIQNRMEVDRNSEQLVCKHDVANVENEIYFFAIPVASTINDQFHISKSAFKIIYQKYKSASILLKTPLISSDITIKIFFVFDNYIQTVVRFVEHNGMYSLEKIRDFNIPVGQLKSIYKQCNEEYVEYSDGQELKLNIGKMIFQIMHEGNFDETSSQMGRL